MVIIMEPEKEEVTDTAASIQIHSIQPKLSSFSVYQAGSG